MDALHTIMKELRTGKVYGKTCEGRIKPYFWFVMYKDGNLIHWRHFGESSNRCNLKDLKWIIKVIFKTTPEKFIEEYECKYCL